jgi:flagellar biosynthesis protein FlhF
MNVKRFVGKNAREAMAQARAACGEEAVVLSNRPVPGGVEILAMAGADLAQPAAPAAVPTKPRRDEPAAEPMSTVSFQQFVRERQRQEVLAAKAPAVPPTPMPPPPRRAPTEPGRFAREALAEAMAEDRPQPRRLPLRPKPRAPCATSRRSPSASRARN